MSHRECHLLDESILVSTKKIAQEAQLEISNLQSLQVPLLFEYRSDEALLTSSSSEGEFTPLYKNEDSEKEHFEYSDVEDYIVGFKDNIAKKTHEIIVGNANIHFSQTNELNALCNKGLILHKGTKDMAQYGSKTRRLKTLTHKKRRRPLKKFQKVRAARRININLEDVCNQVQDISVQILVNGILSRGKTHG